MNVTIYGDSILKWILFENGRYTVNHEWENLFLSKYPVSLRNRSRFGCTIRKGLGIIRNDCRRACGEEYAILEYGGNDCDYDWASIAADPYGCFLSKTPPDEFRKGYAEAIGLIRASGRIPVAVTLPPIDSRRYLRYICRNGISRENILIWLGDVDAIYRRQREYSEIVRDVAEKEGAALIDLRGAFRRAGRPASELLCDDGIHPSRAGQAIIYREFCSRAG